MSGISLIVGLGNPGPRYAATRHNAGARFVQALAEAGAAPWRLRGRFHAEVAEIEIGGRTLLLLLPQTFMNRSGASVAPFVRYHGIAVPELLVVHDDLDLPPGAVRLKRSGGTGGHNGLNDLVARLNSADFVRLRIGIGRPPPQTDTAEYVLQPPTAAERALIDDAMHTARAQLADIVHGRYEAVMNVLHARAGTQATD